MVESGQPRSPLTFACQRKPSWSWVFRGLSSSPSTGCWVAVFGIGGRKMSTLSTDRLGLMLQASSIAATLYLRAPSWTPTLDFLTTWINIISRIIHKQNYKPKVGPSCLGRCPPWRTTRGNSPKHWWVVVVEMLLPLLVWYWYVIAVIYLVFFLFFNLTQFDKIIPRLFQSPIFVIVILLDSGNRLNTSHSVKPRTTTTLATWALIITYQGHISQVS